MKNKFLYLVFFIFFTNNIFAENIEMKADSITLDKISQKSIFKKNVVIKDEDGTVIKSDYAEYDKNKSIIF